jgi:DNA-binding transcriptional regulator LsrR (DeoR family)
MKHIIARLYEVHGMTIGEIADHLKISTASVREALRN